MLYVCGQGRLWLYLPLTVFFHINWLQVSHSCGFLSKEIKLKVLWEVDPKCKGLGHTKGANQKESRTFVPGRKVGVLPSAKDMEGKMVHKYIIKGTVRVFMLQR